VPIGARVPTKNPNRFEVDPQPEPDQATWAKLSITAEGSDGGIVDAEIIRPRSWILRNGICVGRMLPFNLPELEVSGLALVTAIDRRTGCLAPIWAPCLLASHLAPYRVPSTDLGTLFASIPPWRRTGCLAPIWGHRFRPLFASIPPGALPGAWHRFGPPVC
jgi:hypothetical protein